MAIKIIHLITSLEGGGTENFLHQILANSPPGYDHRVFYIKKDGVIGERLRRAGVSVQRAGSMLAFYQTLRREKPQILHTCLYSAHIVGRYLGHFARVPAIITSQRSIDIWQKPWQTWLDTWTLRWSTAVMVNSHAAAELIARRRKNASRPEIIEIPNGVDTISPDHRGIPRTLGKSDSYVDDHRLQNVRFHRTEKGPARQRYKLPPEAVVGGSLMRLHPEKGADFIPAFAAEVLPAHPTLHLLIGGVGPLEKMLKDRTARTAYGDRIHWIGWEEDTPGFLGACDFYWSLSREESFPQTLVEASVTGLPWIAPDVGGVPELLAAGTVGLMFPRLDVSAAAGQLTPLLTQLSERSAQAKAAAPTLSEKYSLQKMVERVYQVFERYK